MQPHRIYGFPIAIILSATMMIMLASCTADTADTPDTTPTSVLFDPDDDNTAIHSGNLLYDSFLTSDGRYIFFQSEESKSLVRSNFDGSESLTLTAKTPSFLNSINNQVFFISGTDSGPIYKIDIDGKGETMISDDTAKSIIVLKSVLYYISALDEQVYRILHDGSKKTLIYPGKSSEIMYFGNTLYIQPAAPDEMVYSIAEPQLSAATPDHPIGFKDFHPEAIDFYPSSVNIERNTLYFSDELFSGVFYLNAKGQTKALRSITVNQPFIVSSRYLYFVNSIDKNRLYRLSLDNPGKTQMVVNDSISKFVIIGNSIYYKRTVGFDIYRTSVGGGQSQKIT